MPDTADPGPAASNSPPAPGHPAVQPTRWWSAAFLAFLAFLPLDWLLVRLIWLPFYFGLFFFLVAGLLVGGASFRYARPARPVSRGRLLLGIGLIVVAGLVTAIVLEYRHFANTVAGDRAFPEARNAAVAGGEPVGQIEAEAAAEFKAALQRDDPPGGVIGYIRWAVTSGKLELTVRGSRETATNEHRGYRWPIRTMAAALLLALGLWLSLESLRSPTPVSNILAPGEEAEED